MGLHANEEFLHSKETTNRKKRQLNNRRNLYWLYLRQGWGANTQKSNINEIKLPINKLAKDLK